MRNHRKSTLLWLLATLNVSNLSVADEKSYLHVLRDGIDETGQLYDVIHAIFKGNGETIKRHRIVRDEKGNLHQNGVRITFELRYRSGTVALDWEQRAFAAKLQPKIMQYVPLDKQQSSEMIQAPHSPDNDGFIGTNERGYKVYALDVDNPAHREEIRRRYGSIAVSRLSPLHPSIENPKRWAMAGPYTRAQLDREARVRGADRTLRTSVGDWSAQTMMNQLGIPDDRRTISIDRRDSPFHVGSESFDSYRR